MLVLVKRRFETLHLMSIEQDGFKRVCEVTAAQGKAFWIKFFFV